MSTSSTANDDSRLPLIPNNERKSSGCMAAGWNQFWLLFCKNLILAKRSKLWLLFELVLPCLFTLPIIGVVVAFANTEDIPAHAFNPSLISGTYDDINRNVAFTSRIKQRWIHAQEIVKIGYNNDIGSQDVAKMIGGLESRYDRSYPKIKFVPFDNTTILLQTLKQDIFNISGYGVYIGKYAGGIVFKELDINQRKLDYSIYLPNLPASEGDVFKIGTFWDDPYGPPNNDYNKLDGCYFKMHAGRRKFLNPEVDRVMDKVKNLSIQLAKETEEKDGKPCPTHYLSGIPQTPPYWSSGFLTFQYGLDSIFIKLTGGSELPEVRFQRIAEYSYRVHSVGVFVKYLPLLWGLCAFLVVVHAGRDISHERSTVKSFLSVMGLSTPMFYFSHIIYSWIKCMIIFGVCAVPLTVVMQNVSILLFYITVFLYGLGAVFFAAVTAAAFKSPNSVLKFLIIAWIATVLLPYLYTIRTEQILLCFINSLNINGAFYFAVAAMADNMYRESALGFWNMFQGGTYNFVLGYALLMMIFDIIWMGAVVLILDLYSGEGDFNLRGFFAKEGAEEADAGIPPLAQEEDANLRAPQIEVNNLVKIWSETGERAVDGFSLKASPGGVTVLLGHNGAGKSTTFSILCGLIRPTSGEVKICDETVKPGQAHHKVGLCPQGNALFDKLTVDEHLWLISGLKNSKNYVAEGKTLKDRLGLFEKSKELSMNLSGGMKRKLCVCLALIGNSQVVLLDEPTAGMDPGARRDVEKLLEEEKKQRTILLTTHYMDEAELLGDKIAIMFKGRIACVGSPQFLKKEFGTGYILTVVTNEKTKAETAAVQLREFVATTIPNVQIATAHGRQLELILPKEGQHQFPELFSRLEKRQGDLRVSSFGLSLNTLEQVFLSVGEKAEERDINSLKFIDQNTEDAPRQLIQSQNELCKTGFSLVSAQLCSIFKKRFIYSIRNWPQLVTQVGVPLLILFFTTWLSNYQHCSGGNDYSRLFGRDDFGPSRVLLQVEDSTPISDTYRGLIKSWTGSQLVEIAASENLTAKMITLPKTLPATGMGAIFGKGVIDILFNQRAPHAIATSMNLLSNSRLKMLGEGHISTEIFAYSQPASSSKIFSSGVIDTLLGPMLMVALAFATSTFVMFYVDERKAKFAHQQSLTGVSPLVFWGGSLAYDVIFYTIVCGAFLIFFLVSGWLKAVIGYVVLLWFLYFWAVMPFIYTVSFMFSSPSKANIVLIIWQIIAAIFAIIILLVLNAFVATGQVDRTVMEITRTALLMFLPSFALGNGLMTLGVVSLDPGVFGLNSNIMEWDGLGKNVACMAIFGLLSFVTFIAFQFKCVRKAFAKIWDIRFCKENIVVSDVQDDDVIRERARIEEPITSARPLVEVKELCKYFGKVHAVENLTMGIDSGECFGLLGVNGAGKTTTFDILTGQSFPTRGSAIIDKHDVTEHIAIGYCPQFDALMMDFTGRETLIMIASMYGFNDPKRKADLVLRAVGMESHGDKLIRYCSGGQRRKISVGLALLAYSKIVILDEPTAGIDPKARREVWRVLTAVRNDSQSALLLTSHSMDECEALCTRIAMLKKGQMIAIGESQHLKSKYGNNFTLTLTLNHKEDRDEVDRRVKERFTDSELKTHETSNNLTLKWRLPRRPDDYWSTKYAECLKLADELGEKVKDFCLTQSSLEETFLHLSKDKNDYSDGSSTHTQFRSQELRDLTIRDVLRKVDTPADEFNDWLLLTAVRIE